MTTTIKHANAALPAAEAFVPRHIGPDAADIQKMVNEIGFKTLDELIDATIPAKIRFNGTLDLGPGKAEHEVLAEFRAMAA